MDAVIITIALTTISGAVGMAILLVFTRADIRAIKAKFHADVRRQFDSMKLRFDSMKLRLEDVEARLNQFKARLKQVEARLEQVEARLATFEREAFLSATASFTSHRRRRRSSVTTTYASHSPVSQRNFWPCRKRPSP